MKRCKGIIAGEEAMYRNAEAKRITDISIFIIMAFIMAMQLVSCAPTKPLPQVRRHIEPAEVQGAVTAEQWDLAATAYEHLGQGMDYSGASVQPVLLVFKNKGDKHPVVPEYEAWAATGDEQLMPYSMEEAARLIFDSTTFEYTLKNSAKTGGLGAALGAGLGALIGAAYGGDAIWHGILGGAVGGGSVAMAASVIGSENALKRVIRNELRQYAWHSTPVPTGGTLKAGYIYFPVTESPLDTLHVKVREGETVVKEYTLPITDLKMRDRQPKEKTEG